MTDNVPPEGGPAEPVETSDAAGFLQGHVARTKERFHRARRVLSFHEYLDLFVEAPGQLGRGAAEYVTDLFDHFGSDDVVRPWGTRRRFRLFDAPWASENQRSQQRPLVGQEDLQAELYRALCNFVREGRANRLLLMHGPNGSAKSTAVSIVMRALEVYSHLDEGALYRFHWIFPTQKHRRGAIGFGGEADDSSLSYAHLPDEAIDARLVVEIRDHPLFLIDAEHRRGVVDELLASRNQAQVGLSRLSQSSWLYEGELCHKNKQIFEALLSAYHGDLHAVLRHVQVERYFVSRRYRTGAVTLGPEMSVDARERQITADRSVTALPTSLQATTLFEVFGEVVEAAGGILEFSDMLKRPLDAFRYLQLTLETGQVALTQQNLFTNVVMLGSANDVHLEAFRDHPEYRSFRGRLDLIRVPYLRDYHQEQAIYDQMLAAESKRHVAPHATRLAAEFAVLSRLLRPRGLHYPKPYIEAVESLSVTEKADLFAEGSVPARFSADVNKWLRANIATLYAEPDREGIYEGQFGASPRTMRAAVLDAAQSSDYSCLSPFALLDELDDLCGQSSDYDWLGLKPLSGGYHDHEFFRSEVRRRLLDRTEADFRAASGLIDEAQYSDLFGRYIQHVSAWLKKERVKNPVTGDDQDADEALMTEVEGLMGVEGEAKEHRESVLSTIAAWAIENPDGTADALVIFPDHVATLQDTAFRRLREPFAERLQDLLRQYRDAPGTLKGSRATHARALLTALELTGYRADSACDAASALLRDRYNDIVH